MALNLANRVFECLKNSPEKRFTARDVALWIYEEYPKECKEKQERSTAQVSPLDTDAALIQQLIREIGSQRKRIQAKYAEIKTTDGKPRQYYYSHLTDEAEVSFVYKDNIVSESKVEYEYTEAGLYPVLSDFLWTDLGILSKRIDEKRSHNSFGPRGNRWLYPDVVGLEDLSKEWHKEIKDVVKEMSDQKTKCWSFEVKKIINRSNVRESYFQAVSNSSWANFGYLVAVEIQGAEKELRILSGVHGIGLIKLDLESPADSEIMIPARERINVDWHTANRLAEENADFLEYIKLIRQFYQTGEHRTKDWDVPKD